MSNLSAGVYPDQLGWEHREESISTPRFGSRPGTARAWNGCRASAHPSEICPPRGPQPSLLPATCHARPIFAGKRLGWVEPDARLIFHFQNGRIISGFFMPAVQATAGAGSAFRLLTATFGDGAILGHFRPHFSLFSLWMP